MPKLIKTWKELDNLESEHYRIELEKCGCCGWIVPKEETDTTEEYYFEHHVYLSTHTFDFPNDSTKTLQKFGFDVEIVGWR